jgi:hypothetical protein
MRSLNGTLFMENSTLFDVVNTFEQSIPTDAEEMVGVGIGTDGKPDEQRFAHDVVFWYEAPVATIG